MAETPSAIRLDQVTLSHGARVLVEKADLALAPGSFTVRGPTATARRR